MRQMLMVLIVSLMGVALLACTGTGMKSDAKPDGGSIDGSRQVVSVDGNDVFEECFEAKVGQTIAYSFYSQSPLKYNFHWHKDADTVHYEVKKDNVDNDSYSFVAPKDEYYCLMWRNYEETPVTLSFECTVK